jgi:hypothetical protein
MRIKIVVVEKYNIKGVKAIIHQSELRTYTK